MAESDSLLCPFPSRLLDVLNAEVVEDAMCKMLNQVINCVRVKIEARHGRQDLDAKTGQFEHVLQMNRIEWRLTRDEQKRSTLFESHVGRTVHKVTREARRDGGK